MRAIRRERRKEIESAGEQERVRKRGKTRENRERERTSECARKRGNARIGVCTRETGDYLLLLFLEIIIHNYTRYL